MTQAEQISNIIKNHEKWLKSKGKEGVRADFSGMTLDYIDFKYCNLSEAIFNNATLKSCDFSYANLDKTEWRNATITEGLSHNVNLSYAKFANATISTAIVDSTIRSCEFYNSQIIGSIFTDCHMPSNMFKYTWIIRTLFNNAYLAYSKFTGARLKDNNFEETFMYDSDFLKCEFDNCGFEEAHLSLSSFTDCEFITDCSFDWACLTSCVLDNIDATHMIGANFSNSRIRDTVTNIYCPMTCPEVGSFIGWKKAVYDNTLVIIKLEIPEHAKRSSGTTRKCRASEAKVLEIQKLEDPNSKLPDDVVAKSLYALPAVEYKVGQTVKCTEEFDEDRFEDCASGIHFFITRAEAEKY